MHVKNGRGLFFDPEEYANVAPVEDKLDFRNTRNI